MADLTGLGAVADLAKSVVDRLFPNKTEEQKAELAGALAVMQGQLDVNKVEAASSSTFVAGWRPFIGWVCGAALCYTYILYPLLTWVVALWRPDMKPPVLGIDNMLYELLLGMLGLGGLRTFEKVKGVAR